jgi:hypothetical protein
MSTVVAEQIAIAERPAEGPELTGIPAPNGHPVPLPESQKWITRRLIDSTKRVWSKRYGRPITTEEAVEILVNVRNLAAAFLEALEKGEQE